MLAIAIALTGTLIAQTPDEIIITGTNKVSKQELPAAVVTKLEQTTIWMKAKHLITTPFLSLATT